MTKKISFIILSCLFCLSVISAEDFQVKHDIIFRAKTAGDTSLTNAVELLEKSLLQEDLTDSLKAEISFELAIQLYNIGKFEGMLNLFDNAFLLLGELNNLPYTGRAYLKYGQVYASIGGTSGEVFELYQKSLNIGEQLLDYPLIIGAQFSLSRLFLKYNEFDIAKRYLENVENSIEKYIYVSGLENDSLLCILNLSYFELFMAKGMYNSAFHFARKGLSYAAKAGDNSLLSRGNSSLGELAIRENKFEQAEVYYKTAIEYAHKINNYANLSDLYTKLAYTSHLQKEDQKALEYNFKALGLRQKYGANLMIGSSYSNIGAIYLTMGKLDSAETYLFSGLDISLKHKQDEFILYNYQKLLTLYEEMGKYEKALLYSKKYCAYKDSLYDHKNISGLLKSISGETIQDKEHKIQELTLLNNQTKTLYSIGVIFLVLLIAIVITTYLYHKNKKVANEYKRAKEEAQRADELKSQFLSQMSHEIRTPLNSIANFSVILSEHLEGVDSPETKESIEIIDSEIKRIIRTMGLILDMAQIQSENYHVIRKNINIKTDIIDKTVAEYKIEINSKKLDLLVASNIDEPVVSCDPYSVEQIFRNIFDNAVKFTNTGKIEVLLNRDIGNVIEVKIIDTGVGISREYMTHLFEAFSQEESGYTRSFEGNGLGLSLVKKFCELNGIDIFVESEKGEGTIVTLLFKAVAS